VRFVIPLHPNPLVRAELGAPLADYANVVRTEPLAYAPFARLMSRAALIVTDSGGIQEEAPALGVPVLVARESTERGEGVKAGMLRLVGTNPDRILAEARVVLGDPAAHRVDPDRNPYGDGRAARRIVTALEYVAGLKEAPEQFGPGFSRRAVLEAAGYPTSLLDRPLHERNAQPDRSEEHDRWVGR
jgi:UDP-N-acetylglucosamine 2-epimerase (non-hydrolysing)